MSQETPPPIPPPSPPTLGAPPPPPENSGVRWLFWVLASTVAPALPWATYSDKAWDDGGSVLVMTALALILQLAASIAVAISFCRRRSFSTGGAIGMTVVFMIASVAIGTAVWFAVCAARVAAPNFH